MSHSANIYHRGPFLQCMSVSTSFSCSNAFIFVLSNRKHFEAKQFNSVLLFFVAPLTAWPFKC
jgi:hypothetical protein